MAQKTNISNKNIGISLSGGGAKGIAHIGVLKALEENGISPQFVSGTSAGAMVGVLYAAGKTPDQILKITKKSSLFKLFTWRGATWRGFADVSYIRDVFELHISADDFGALSKKFYVAAANISQGKGEIISEGKLFDAVIASASMPLVFKPTIMHGDAYIDGGLFNNLPVEPLKEQCKTIIGVNVCPCGYADNLSNIINIFDRCFSLMVWANVETRLKSCDIAIQPETSAYGTFDISKADEIFQVGYDAAIAHMPDILEKIEKTAFPIWEKFPITSVKKPEK